METVDRSLKRHGRGALSLLEVEDGIPSRVLDTPIENFEIARRGTYEPVEEGDRAAFDPQAVLISRKQRERLARVAE